MDSQDSSAAPHHHRPQHHHHHHHHQIQHQHPHQHQSLHHHLQIPQQQQQPSSAMLVAAAAAQNQLQSQSHNHNSYPHQNPMNSNHHLMRQHQQHQQQHNQSAPHFFNSMVAVSPASKIDYSDGAAGSSSPTDGGVGGFNMEPSKKKRGRPRKYSPDAAGSSIALGLSPTSVSAVGIADSAGGGALSADTPSKKNRGRPPGTGKRQLDALGVPGVGFTPHVITVEPGEDIASKIMAFAQQGPRAVSILSAIGAIRKVDLEQVSSKPGGVVTIEGKYEIIALSGTYMLSENSGSRHRIGGLRVSFAMQDSKVLGGKVVGVLEAATTVQVVVGSYILDAKRLKTGPSASSAQSLGAANMLSFGNQVMGGSPTSHGGSSDSSDDHASPPIDRSGLPFGNAGQTMSNMHMYGNMGWVNSGVKMHPH